MGVDRVVVVGSGQAGFQVAASLRDRGYPGTVTLIGDEPGLPYQRPPLTKEFLSGRITEDALDLRPAHWYVTRGIERVHALVAAVDRERRWVMLADGRQMPYSHLVLATGARNRRLPVPGADLDGVVTLRTLTDARSARKRLRAAANVVIVGGGFIGLEFAAAAREADRKADVTVLEAMPRLMARASSPAISEFFLHAHRREGVDVRLEQGVHALAGKDGRVVAVRLAAGEELPADLVVVGIGVVPNTEIAARAGLPVDDGILVDSNLLTADPHVSAIGDCARYPCGSPDDRLRLESVQNACDQARFVAARLTGGDARYASVPWFWSEQYDHKLQIAGLLGGYDDTVVRGDPGSGSFSVFSYREQRLVCVESVDQPTDHAAARRFLAPGGPVCAKRTAGDLSTDLRNLSKRPSGPDASSALAQVRR